MIWGPTICSQICPRRGWKRRNKLSKQDKNGGQRELRVTLCWDKVKQIEQYQDKAGLLIYERELFKFVDESLEQLKSDPKFIFHSRQMVDTVDMAVGFLGPDLDPLKEDLYDLGKRHIQYGVASHQLPGMERAVMYALEEMIEMSKEESNSWQVVFSFIVSNMTSEMKPQVVLLATHNAFIDHSCSHKSVGLQKAVHKQTETTVADLL